MAEPPRKGGLEKPRMVRTISGMNDQVLKQLVKRVPSLRASKMTRDNSTNSSMSMDELGKFHDEAHLSHISEESMGYMSNSMNMSAMEISLADINYDMEDADDSPMARQEQQALSQLAKTAEQMTKSSGSAKGSPTESPKTTEKSPPPGTLLKRPTLIDSRRNTCGTIYVGSTMSAPDKDATIKVRELMACHSCCVLWRALISLLFHIILYYSVFVGCIALIFRVRPRRNDTRPFTSRLPTPSIAFSTIAKRTASQQKRYEKMLSWRTFIPRISPRLTRLQTFIETSSEERKWRATVSSCLSFMSSDSSRIPTARYDHALPAGDRSSFPA